MEIGVSPQYQQWEHIFTLTLIPYLLLCEVPQLKSAGNKNWRYDCDVNLKIPLISHFMYKRLKKKIKRIPLFTLFIYFFFFLENSNHVLSTDLSSLPLVTGSSFFPECPVKVGKNTEQEALPCWLQPFLLSVMKNEFLVEQFAPLHHWRLASLLDSSTAEGLRYSSISKRDMQQWQLQTLREPMTPCHLLKACKLCLTVVHIWCSKYCA